MLTMYNELLKSYAYYMVFYFIVVILFQANYLSLHDSLVFVSTLDGTLHAVSKMTGKTQWTLQEGKFTFQKIEIVTIFVKIFMSSYQMSQKLNC